MGLKIGENLTSRSRIFAYATETGQDPGRRQWRRL